MDTDQQNSNKKEILRFLKQIGVDTRFTSVIHPFIYINNLRFSKFSRKKEELFNKNYPEIKIIRSTVFQKICGRASKILGDSLKPRQKVLISSNNSPCDIALSVILEPYGRKYGIEIIEKEFELNGLNEIKEDYDVIALPITLDYEVENILGHIFSGEKIELESSKKKLNNVEFIYPLINVPLDWICFWLKLEEDECQSDMGNETAHAFLIYLESVVPQVRENILKSSKFLVEKY